MPGSQEELQEAISDLHEYLADRKAPLMVMDAVGLFLQYPPAFMAGEIKAWMAKQVLGAPVCDYLYHGAKKIFLMGEFELVPRDALADYLKGLSLALLEHCPESDRELLKQNLERLGQAAKTPDAMVSPEALHRPAAQAPPLTHRGAAMAQGVRRLSVLLDHLRPLAAGTMAAGPMAGGPVTAPPEQRLELTSQFMTEAAAQSTSTQELETNLAPLREIGIETGTAQVFRTLASSLAGWVLPPMGGQTIVVSRDQLDAMRRVVAIADDPAEAAKRFREMVTAATEQFNDGHLGRAAMMFELALHVAAEQKIKPIFLEPIRSRGHEQLDQERLRKYAERTDYRTQLRAVLSFFTTLSPHGLLAALDGEPQRERRHQLLALLEVHEQSARTAAVELLAASAEPGARFDPFFQMNLIYLLRVIPRPEEASVEHEINLVMRVSGRSSPPPLVKQTIAYLAHTHQEKAERALITYLKIFESMLIQPETAVYLPEEVEVLLDRTCAALARYGTPRAWRLLIDHGLKNEARLGSPALRLAEAGRVNLSGSRDLVERLLTALKAELPRSGLMVLAGKTNEYKAISIVQALSGTPLPEVQEALEDIVARHSDRKLGEAAAKALKALASVGQPSPPASLSGDLELFGLPNLMQTVSQSQLSGVLSVMNTEGKTQATLMFDQGRFCGGQYGTVQGEAAVYQLLEKPFPGTFAFVGRQDVTTMTSAGAPMELFPLLMEGVRRHDEYKQAVALVGDGAHLRPTDTLPGALEGEEPEFAAVVWDQISSGETPEACEAAVNTDSYRVRRLVAFWVEQGALAPA